MKDAKRRINIPPCSFICHGASEIKIVEFLRSEYRIGFNAFSNKNGSKNIELSSLMMFLNKSPFNSKDQFIAFMKAKYGYFDENNLCKHKIFIIIDEDRYSDLVESFVSKSMFKNHWAYELIIPILARPNLDVCLGNIGCIINTHTSKPNQINKFLVNNKKKFKDMVLNCSKSKWNISDIFNFLDNRKDH